MFEKLQHLNPAVDFQSVIPSPTDGYELDLDCSSDDIPVAEQCCDYYEPGILSGYRPSHSTFKYCLFSIFKIHNETFNIWTQIVPAVYFLIQFFVNLTSGSFFILLYLATTTIFLFISSCAHAFSCISPVARHICFFFDYAGIALYSSGCAVCYYAYALPTELLRSSIFEANICDIYLFLSVFFSIWGTHLSGLTRFWIPSFRRKIVRLAAFFIIWFYLAVPVLWRMAKCGCAVVPNKQAGECASVYYWTLQFFSAFWAGLIYVTHFPERWFPGRVDIFGHSHQIFHVFGASGAFNQYRALLVDYKQRSEYLRSLDHSPSVSLCILCFTVVVFANLIIFLNFYKKLTRKPRIKSS